MENVEGDMKSVALCDFDSAHSHFATFCCKIWFHCAQIELNSWSVTCPPSKSTPTLPQNFPSCHDSIYRSISVFRTRCLFLLGYFPFGSFLNGSGYFQRAIVIFWVREIVRPSYPPRLLSPPPAFPFLRVKANEARDRPKRRPFCWRYFLPLFHSQCFCLFRFNCACIWRNFNNLVLNWKYKIEVFRRGSWLYINVFLPYLQN